MLFILKRLLGVLCLILGLAALVTPMTPGGFLFIIGLELLGLSFLLPKPVREPWVRFKQKLIAKLRRIFRAASS